MNKLLLLLKVSRPAGWVIAPLIFFTGLKVAEASLSLLPIIQLLLLTFPFSLFAFGINDVYDYNSDRFNPRKPSGEGFLLSKKYHAAVKKSAFFAAIALILFSLITRNALTILATAALIILVYSYSAPPLRLKERPLIDSLSNALGVWLLLLLGFSYGATFQQFPLKLYYASSIAASVHAIGAVMDYSSDKKARITTIATLFGKKFAVLFAALIAALILLFSGIQSKALNYYFWLIFLISSATLLFPNERFVRTLFRTAFFAFLIAIIIFLYQQF
jgi:4-hydroxybenzoate polyprenyltransferase